MNNKIKKLKEYIDRKNTSLGIGPMSINTVNAAIDIANTADKPIMLIASRRQIDSKKICKGYVNNWSTEEFVKYVKERDKKNNIIIARDHGGPWQNNMEITNHYSLKEAMDSAKDSFAEDIECGMDIIHIDPSVDIFTQISFDIIFERLIELYDFCIKYSRIKNNDIEFEIGTEEQMIHINNKTAFIEMLNRVNNCFNKNNLKKPLFVVTQIGTKVMETKNIGLLNQQNNEKILSKIKILCDECLRNNFYIKVHNTDYLRAEILKKYPQNNISAANVAPEFGVCETKSFLKLLECYRLISLENEFLELAYDSKKWQKWIITDSKISKRDKAIIAGHYIFSNDKFLILKDKAQKKINIDIDTYLKEQVKENILQYIEYFEILNIKNKKEELCLK